MTMKLLELIAAPENLLSAWRTVRGNIPKYRRQRASGPDGVSLAEFEQDLTTQIKVLRSMLMKGRYQPTPPSYFSIPKSNGQQRVLAILSVRDRVAQRAAQQVLEPMWEPEFLPCSFGFRPGISLDQALIYAQRTRSEENRWVVDGDIAACFDTLDHDLLLGFLKHKIRDGRVISLLHGWLDVGVMQMGPPQLVDMRFARQVESLKGYVKQGFEWVLESFAQHADPYARYGGASYYHDPAVYPEADMDPVNPGAAYPERDMIVTQMKHTALRQAVVSGAMFSFGFLRSRLGGALAKAGSLFKIAVSTPAGRRLLKRNAWTVGGFAGVAAVAAVTAYMMNRKAGPAPVGVLQGSPLSPLLANIYLHPFDVTMLQAGHRLARFADDWVILCPTQEHAETAYNDALRSLDRLHLKVNPAKTRILTPEQELEWLGAVIR
ncbi:MAG: reverse transcriptase domain-containing protein [Anaerolineales bacterium]|nr:MAG: reverse transcriptase domain-containing protein [Anaerolineales bacterium]